MPVTDTRLAPLSRLLLSWPGEGDPRKVLEEFTWPAILAYEWNFGTFERDSDGLPLLEFFPQVGLVCRPFYRPKDTRLSHYLTSGGAWEERRPGTGSPRIYYLVQYDTAAGVQFAATSVFDLPANPSFVLSLSMAATPADWDSATLPQYVRFEWGFTGADGWGIHLDTQAAYLVRWDGSQWQVVADLGGSDRAFTGTEGEESLFFIRTLRGRVWVSADGGKSYVSGGDLNAAVNVAAGTGTVRGQGGLILYGLHQIEYFEGDFTSRAANTLQARSSPTLTLQAVAYHQPAGTDIDLVDESSPGSAVAQWRATLEPDSTTGIPFDFWTTPELYSLLFEYAPVTVGASGAWREPFEGQDQEGDKIGLHVTKPYELDQGSAHVEIRRNPSQPFVWAEGRWLKCQLVLGHVNEDGSTEFLPAFTGYIDVPQVGLETFNEATLVFHIEHMTTRFKRTSWTKFTRPYFRGLTVNQALDRILYSEGLFVSLLGTPYFDLFRLWHPAGNLLIPSGSPEEPNEYELPPVEPKWATIERLCGLACVEFGATDEGGFFTITKDGFQPVLSQLWEAVPTAELLTLVKRLTFTMESSESATRVEVYGRTEWGEEVLAWARNGLASVPGSAFFCPWEETLTEEVPGTVTPGLVIARAQALARTEFPLKFNVEGLESPVRLGISRRDQGYIVGCEQAGVSSFDRYCVLCIEHQYLPGAGMANCKTTAALRRLT